MSRKQGLFLSVCGSALAAVAGCSTLPDSGPSANDVAAQQASAEQGQRYLVVDINGATIEALKHRGLGSFYAQFGDRRLSAEPVVGVGDSVTVTIWEAAAGGLFTAPAVTNTISTGSNSATIPEQTVGRDGGITVPYAGRVHVAGKTTRAVQKEIEEALQGKAIQPQVLVNVTKPVSDSVSVGGEVAQGSRVPLSVKGDRVLDVVDEAGGVRSPVNETFVELSRGLTTSRMPLVRIVADPRENIYMHPNDVLTLVRDPQTFLAYGAMGQNAEIPFDADGITLAEALSKAGGLLDHRSDPRGVFVFRYETRIGGARARSRQSPGPARTADADRLPAEPRRPEQPVPRAQLSDGQPRPRLRVELALDRGAEGVPDHRRRHRDDRRRGEPLQRGEIGRNGRRVLRSRAIDCLQAESTFRLIFADNACEQKKSLPRLPGDCTNPWYFISFSGFVRAEGKD